MTQPTFTAERPLNAREFHSFVQSLFFLTVFTVRNNAVQLLKIITTYSTAELVHLFLQVKSYF